MRKRHIGIDLGTTNTVAAFGGQVLEVEEGRSTLPSVVAFLPNGQTLVGEPARRRRAIDGVNTLFSCKRIIGRRFDSYEVQCFRERYPTELEPVGDEGWPAFRTRAGLFTPVQVATRVLKALVDRTGMDLHGTEVTVTVPANFSRQQREATAEAAAKAGLGEVALLAEPLATAWAYTACGTRAERAFVYDLGGGTFDCAVVDCTQGEPSLLAHTSDLMLGGDDLDQRLAALVRHQVLARHNWDLASYSEVYDRLLAECEKAKILLSTEERAEFLLAQVDPECPAAGETVELDRRLLEVQCRELMQRSFGACDQALRQANLKASDIDAVFLAGGTTLLSVVQEGVAAYFGRPGAMGIDPTEVVALGASLAPR